MPTSNTTHIRFSLPRPHILSYDKHLSPLLTRRALYRASLPPTNPPLHKTPHITPLNIWLAETSSKTSYISFPTPPTSSPSNPCFPPPLPSSPASPSFIDGESPPCPIKEPHLHGDNNPYRPYRYRHQNPHERELRLLAEFGIEAFWEGGNPPPKVWDCLWSILGTESGEDTGRDEGVVHAYRYWHCCYYRQKCRAYEGKERAWLRVLEDGKGEEEDGGGFIWFDAQENVEG